MDHLQSFIADCDRRTEVAKKRLAETQEEISAEVAAKVSMSDKFLLSFWRRVFLQNQFQVLKIYQIWKFILKKGEKIIHFLHPF